MNNWIAIDWGTSNLRAWHLDAAGNVLDFSSSASGMASLTSDDFEGALLGVVESWVGENTLVICCGMVGAKQGWHEVAYANVPCKPSARLTAPIHTNDRRLELYILPGVSQLSPPDVMRGEETQIAGFIDANPDWDGVICLPGTHTKWVHISAGEIVSFRTFMTGELFGLLSENSVLRHSLATGPTNMDAFVEAVSRSISRPEALAGELFGIRAGDILHGRDKSDASAILSGTLIGAELAAARAYWLGQPIAIIGAAALAELYETALKQQGQMPMIVDATDMTLGGLYAAYKTQLKAAT